MTYAQVIVDLSAEAVDRRFSYAVPVGMDVQPGQLVAVPFGLRTLEGFVVSLSGECDLPPEKVKPILRVVRGPKGTTTSWPGRNAMPSGTA